MAEAKKQYDYDLFVIGSGSGGDLVTREEFGDFEFEFEWKVAPGSNSGIKYRHAKYNEGLNGLEYQILDDAKHTNGKDPYSSAAAMYLLAPRSTDEPLKAAGHWNTGKIVAKADIASYAAHLLARDVISFVDVRSARNNCFQARIVRAV